MIQKMYVKIILYMLLEFTFFISIMMFSYMNILASGSIIMIMIGIITMIVFLLMFTAAHKYHIRPVFYKRLKRLLP